MKRGTRKIKMLCVGVQDAGVEKATITCWLLEAGSVSVFTVAHLAHLNPSACKHRSESCGTQEMWAAVLVLLSLCSSAHREEEDERGKEEGWRENNELSIQLLVAFNAHRCSQQSPLELCVLNDYLTKTTLLLHFYQLIDVHDHFRKSLVSPRGR